jgi:hypothetical protein
MPHMIVPNGRWTYWESSNMRGSPANHILDSSSGRTFCGRDAEGWDRPYWLDVAEMDRTQPCKVCLRVWRRSSDAASDAGADKGCE